MQPNPEPIHVARRPLDLEDYIDIVRRHRGWIFGPVFLALVAAVVVAYAWPDTYVSTAVIRVVPPQIPERLVPSNVNAEIDQRINSMSQAILSRNTLSGMIQTYNLYPSERQRMPMEDVVENMRKSIRVGRALGDFRTRSGSVSAFSVSFSYPDRMIAQRVTSELVTRFIDENVRTRSSQSVLTTQFLRDQFEQAKRELDAVEQRLSEFRAKNFGRLPEQVETNLQQMAVLETRLSTIQSALSRSANEKLLLEAQVQTLNSQLSRLQSPPPEAAALPVRNERIEQLERDIERLRMTLSALRERYRESHPDVQRLESQLNVLEAARDKLAAEEKAKPPAERASRQPDPSAGREAAAIQATIAKTKSLIQVQELESANLMRERERVEKSIAEIRDRLQISPVNDSEYSRLIQDRNLARMRYDELDRKRNQSELASDLENQRAGETLELLDPASLPQSPSAPNRARIILVGLMAGLVLGVGLAFTLEVKDTSLKNLKDVRAYTKLSVLASVPLLENDLLVRRRRRVAWLLWSGVGFLGAVIMAASVILYHMKRS